MLRGKKRHIRGTANAEIITLMTTIIHRDMDRQTVWGNSARPTSNNLHPCYVSANYNYRIEENVNFYLKMNYTSKTEDAVCRQYPSLCASAGITFSFPDKRLQLNIACHDMFRKEHSDREVRYYNINNNQKNNVDSRFCSIYLRYNINKTSRKNKVKDVDNVLNRL